MWHSFVGSSQNYGHLKSSYKQKARVHFLMLKFRIFSPRETSGFGRCRNVLWPGELGSSSFSPVRHQMNGLGARMQISKTHCTQQIAHSNIHGNINCIIYIVFYAFWKSIEFVQCGHKLVLCETFHIYVRIWALSICKYALVLSTFAHLLEAHIKESLEAGAHFRESLHQHICHV